MRIRLKSDFHDYYDHWFAGSWQDADLVFERFTRSGPSRPEMMSILAGQGMRVPLYGRVRDLASELPGEAEVVVHLDELAHQAKGKIKCPAGDALESYPDHFGVEYISSGWDGGYTLRCVCFGHRAFWLEYYSPGDWRSNVGDASISVLAPAFRGDGVFQDTPLWAVDYVPAGGCLYAIDFNIAPRLSGTGLEQWVSGKEVFEEIVSFFQRDRLELSV